MKIGILGGTFDPIHNAHLHIAKAALEEYGLDRVWLMPAGNPYFKKDQHVTPAADRLEMTRLAASEYHPLFEASDYEITGQDASHQTYTADTLSSLQKERPSDRFYFILGLDSLLALNSWYHTGVILENAVLLYAMRPDQHSGVQDAERCCTFLKERYAAHHPEICRIHTDMLEISSTMIRSMAAEGRDIRHLVPESVAAYIAAKGLYQS